MRGASVLAIALVGVLLGACKGETRMPPAIATGGSSGLDSGGVADGAAPDGAVRNAFPCGSSEPLPGGFERCEDLTVRRVSLGSCPSQVPRAEPIPNYQPGDDACEYDAECADLPLGHCGQWLEGWSRQCVAGCVSDADCRSGEACFCDDPVGRCIPAACSTGSDCEPGFDCVAYTARPGCYSTALACQTHQDSCVPGECEGINPSSCVLLGGSFGCAMSDQCTEP
jgi:hypothetical protein